MEVCINTGPAMPGMWECGQEETGYGLMRPAQVEQWTLHTMQKTFHFSPPGAVVVIRNG